MVTKNTWVKILFGSRWLQLPLYLGLIIVQLVYVSQFGVELYHLISLAYHGELSETIIITMVLGLIDVVMISNLLLMVIVGGYETFVSRMDLSNHPDQPEWLGHINSGVLKVKLATAIIGISSVHLLKTFMDASNYESKTLIAQGALHVVFLISALSLAYINKIDSKPEEDSE